MFIQNGSKLTNDNVCALLVLFLNVFFCPDTNAQASSWIQKTDSIKTGIIDFLISEKALESGQSFKDYDTHIYALEMVDQSALGMAPVGVYKLGTHSTHPKEYILIRDYTYYKILDTEQLGTTIKTVTDFLLEKKYSTSQIGDYMQAILGIYEYNHSKSPEIGEP